jgi:uncharacterized OB-fold protein
MMKGMKCKCGFATISDKRICPRCGKRMKPEEWKDEGKVVSFTRLQAVPEGLQDPYNLALVAVPKGPKLVCWTSGMLKENDPVTIVEQKGKYLCSLRTAPGFKLDPSKLD